MIASLLRKLRDTFYRSGVKTIVRRSGLNNYLSGPFWNLVNHFSSPLQKVEIGGEEITFVTHTSKEFNRFRTLAGEREMISAVIDSLEPDDVFYDIGANVGMYTCFAAQKVDSGHVVAFEPETKNARSLQENLKKNGLKAEMFELALSDRNGEVNFQLTGDSAGEGEHSIIAEESATSVKVPTAKGDYLIENENLNRPDVMKIDVEGAEHEVLQGMKNTIKLNDCRRIYVEIHPKKMTTFGSSPEMVEELLEKSGFEVTHLQRRHDEFFIKASK